MLGYFLWEGGGSCDATDRMGKCRREEQGENDGWIDGLMDGWMDGRWRCRGDGKEGNCISSQIIFFWFVFRFFFFLPYIIQHYYYLLITYLPTYLRTYTSSTSAVHCLAVPPLAPGDEGRCGFAPGYIYTLYIYEPAIDCTFRACALYCRE